MAFDFARVLATGVGAWLQFEFACDRSGLFSEKYLTHPIGRILSARSANRAVAEYLHPVLANFAKGAGRRPEIDFAVCDPYPKISIAVESKWIGQTSPSVASILWDLIRLELLAHTNGARCFFVLGGKRSALEALFAKAAFSGVSAGERPRPMLRADLNLMHRTKLTPHGNPRIPLLRSLFSHYQHLELPHMFISRRSAPYPVGQPRHVPQVYVWEISSAKNRETFWPRNSRHYSASGKSRRDHYRSRAAIEEKTGED